MFLIDVTNNAKNKTQLILIKSKQGNMDVKQKI